MKKLIIHEEDVYDAIKNKIGCCDLEELVDIFKRVFDIQEASCEIRLEDGCKNGYIIYVSQTEVSGSAVIEDLTQEGDNGTEKPETT